VTDLYIHPVQRTNGCFGEDRCFIAWRGARQGSRQGTCNNVSCVDLTLLILGILIASEVDNLKRNSYFEGKDTKRPTSYRRADFFWVNISSGRETFLFERVTACSVSRLAGMSINEQDGYLIF
jgi:hypothetical protein